MSTFQPEDQPDTEEIRTFVIAGHGNLEKVQQMLAARPSLLNIAHKWGPGDTETALQGAAHVGHTAIADYLLSQGAPLDICTAAMLGRRADVETFLAQDIANVHANGAHGIPLLSHVALSGDVRLAAMLHRRGATTGSTLALSLTVSKGHLEMASWLLENGSPDLAWKNFQGKTALAVAVEKGSDEIAALLRTHGAIE